MTSGADLVTVSHRFRGPPGCGNGGYVAGLIAEWIEGPASISLLAPTPLDVPLHRRREGGEVTLADNDRIYARGKALDTMPDLRVPPPPSDEEIEAAAQNYPDGDRHPVPGCFVCGVARDPGDAMCLTPGESPARDTAVAQWLTPSDFTDEHGHVAERLVWAALDCPSYFGLGPPWRRLLLARIEGRIERPVIPGERLRVTGWEVDREGRKFHCATALHDDDGALVASARALWVEVAELPA